MKYSNDLELADLVREFNRESSPFNYFLTNGQLSLAFSRALELQTLLVKIQRRINEIQYP